jgi:hypothetical protein
VGRVAELGSLGRLSAMTRRRFITLACLTTVGLLLAAVLVRRSTTAEALPRLFTNQNPAFVVLKFEFTQGTNHTVGSGNSLLGKLNASLISARKKPWTSARQWTITTTQDTSVLWVTYMHSNALAGKVRPYITGLLTRPGAGDELIRCGFGTQLPKRAGNIEAWVFPARATNFHGCWFHFVTVPQGEKLASFEL